MFTLTTNWQIVNPRCHFSPRSCFSCRCCNSQVVGLCLVYTRRAKGSKQGCDTNLSTASVLFWTGRATPLKEPPPGLRRARSRPGALDKHPDCPARAACVLVVVLTVFVFFVFLATVGCGRLRRAMLPGRPILDLATRSPVGRLREAAVFGLHVCARVRACARACIIVRVFAYGRARACGQC